MPCISYPEDMNHVHILLNWALSDVDEKKHLRSFRKNFYC